MLGKADILAMLDRLDIAYSLLEHDAVMTVAEAKAIRGHITGMACKCLFLQDKGNGFWLVALPSEQRADLRTLAARLGARRLSFADEDAMFRLLGLRPGAVSVLGAANDTNGLVRIVLEKRLLDAATPLLFHPLVNTATVSLQADDLLRFLEHCGHTPRVIDTCDTAHAEDMA